MCSSTCEWCGSTDCDCQERIDCPKAGMLGHWFCGKYECGCPRFVHIQYECFKKGIIMAHKPCGCEAVGKCNERGVWGIPIKTGYKFYCPKHWKIYSRMPMALPSSTGQQ